MGETRAIGNIPVNKVPNNNHHKSLSIHFIADIAGMGGAEKIEKGHAPTDLNRADKAECKALNIGENRHINGVYQGHE